MELDIIKNSTTWNDAAGSINNNFEKLRLSVEEGGESSVTVDTEVSDTSTNPIANKSIKKYVDDEVEDAKAYSEEKADNAETAAKKYADDNKVAKVEGKQLSTEDFTTTLRQKLDGLTNYDDADVRSAIEELQNNLDAIVNGDATSAIDSIQEILAFLSTITDTQTLAGIVADLKQYVDDKVASGISEEKEVYIGSEEPPVGAKVWIDPTGTPSGGNGGSSSGGSASALIVYPGVKLDGTDLTEAQKSNNAAVYAELKEANESDRTLPFVSVDLSDFYRSATGGRTSVVCTCFGCIYIPNVMAVLSIAFDPTAPMNFQLTEDGNVVLETQQTN